MLTGAMTALRAHERGGAEKFRVEVVAIPQPLHDEVVVKVRAAGITFAELDWDATWTRDGTSRLPVTPAHEVSGTVAAIGIGVHSLHVGDEVFGLIPFDQDGAAAGFARVPEASLAIKPVDLPHIAAASLPLAGLTAWSALVEHGQIHRGERVLVHGGAGAVGSVCVQLAKTLGADVTATSRPADYAFVRSLGAQGVVDIDQFDREPNVYDIVIDTIGGPVAQRSIKTLRSGGRLICLTAPPPILERTDVQASFFVVSPNQQVLTELGALVTRGELRVPIAHVFPLSRGREAYESGSQQPRRPGKTLIAVDTSELRDYWSQPLHQRTNAAALAHAD